MQVCGVMTLAIGCKPVIIIIIIIIIIIVVVVVVVVVIVMFNVAQIMSIVARYAEKAREKEKKQW